MEWTWLSINLARRRDNSLKLWGEEMIWHSDIIFRQVQGGWGLRVGHAHLAACSVQWVALLDAGVGTGVATQAWWWFVHWGGSFFSRRWCLHTPVLGTPLRGSWLLELEQFRGVPSSVVVRWLTSLAGKGIIQQLVLWILGFATPQCSPYQARWRMGSFGNMMQDPLPCCSSAPVA